jgi:hypothetical protein
MRHLLPFLLSAVVVSGSLAQDLAKGAPPALAKAESVPNTLTDEERKDGWRLLWDGKTTDGWRSPKSPTAFPTNIWAIQDGEWVVKATGNPEKPAGGDIITRDRFSNFELSVDFKISPGCNSGIKIFFQPDVGVGLEYQILDDARHPDAKLGRNGNRTLGSLYDLVPPATTKKPNPIGRWNTARIVARGNHVEHWLNGEKVLEYERGSAAFRQAVAESKFNKIHGFGEWRDGHILLQEHGSEVAFRNIKIKERN